MTLESWRYRDPQTIIDSLRAETKREEGNEAKRQAMIRKHKARRIQALVKGAMRGLAK